MAGLRPSAPVLALTRIPKSKSSAAQPPGERTPLACATIPISEFGINNIRGPASTPNTIASNTPVSFTAPPYEKNSIGTS
jgi:hypothetical protein